jgi:hypothetical protein
LIWPRIRDTLYLAAAMHYGNIDKTEERNLMFMSEEVAGDVAQQVVATLT